MGPPLVVPVSREILQMLQRRAAREGLDCTTLAAMLLEVVAKDNLYDAVLDQY